MKTFLAVPEVLSLSVIPLVDKGNRETVVVYSSALLMLYGKWGVRNDEIEVKKIIIIR